MKKWRSAFTAAFGFIAALALSGCQQKVITVADMQEEEGKTAEYIEMQEFELKEAEEDNGREELLHCVVLIPAGYHESEEISGMYLHEKAPLDSSNVYYSVSEGMEGTVSENLTKQQYQAAIEEAFAESGKEVALKIESFETVDMEGVPAYKIRSEYEMDGNTIQQLTYMILAENTYTITYSQSADDELMADFAVSDGEIKLMKAKEVQIAASE